MKRRVWNAMKTAVNEVVHGGSGSCLTSVDETGTSILVEKKDATHVNIKLILRGLDVPGRDGV